MKESVSNSEGAKFSNGLRVRSRRRRTVRSSMTLKEFATIAGVLVLRCDSSRWGGTWGYTTADSPNCRFLGYYTEAQIYRAWAEETFGEDTYRALAKLLSPEGRKQTARPTPSHLATEKAPPKTTPTTN